MNALIGWALLMVPAYIGFAAYCSRHWDGDDVPVSIDTLKYSAMMFFPLWWGLYFLIWGVP